MVGMNTGFYSTLTAVMGFDVHSFDIQLDCFDIARKLLTGNDVRSRASFYHFGLWSNFTKMTVKEGCEPGRGIDNYQESSRPVVHRNWTRREHSVATIRLDSFLLDSTTTAMHGKDVAILKLDIEGAEIAALRGLSNPQQLLSRVQNIILECAPARMRRLGFSVDDARDEFRRLQQEGDFTAYLLYQPLMPLEEWGNDDFLIKNMGVRATPIHPILGHYIANTKRSNVVIWRVENWDLLLKKGACRRACNLLFTKMGVNEALTGKDSQ